MARLSLLMLLLAATMMNVMQSSGGVHATPDDEFDDELEDPTTPPATAMTPTPQTTEGPNAVSLTLSDQNRSQYFSYFAEFEKKSNSYMNNMKRYLATILLSYSFIFNREVQPYITESPTNSTIEITKYTRDVCDCDGVRMSPCPSKCQYSCYGTILLDELRYHEDCRHKYFDICKCYEGAYSSDCDKGRLLKNCYTSATETIPVDKECLAYRIDDKNISKSFESISAELVKPIKTHFWRIETELYYLKETAVLVDHFRGLVSEMCQGPSSKEDPTCAREATNTLTSEISRYGQIKSNITKELFSTQRKIRDIYGSFKSLKDQHVMEISKSSEKYACCLKASISSTPSNNPNCTAETQDDQKRPEEQTTEISL